jgi:hypothetical protein
LVCKFLPKLLHQIGPRTIDPNEKLRIEEYKNDTQNQKLAIEI